MITVMLNSPLNSKRIIYYKYENSINKKDKGCSDMVNSKVISYMKGDTKE